MGLASTLSIPFLMGGCQVRGMKETGLLGLLEAALKLVLAGGKGQAICGDDLDPQCCICQLWGSPTVCCPLLRAAVCVPSFLLLLDLDQDLSLLLQRVCASQWPATLLGTRCRFLARK